MKSAYLILFIILIGCLGCNSTEKQQVERETIRDIMKGDSTIELSNTYQNTKYNFSIRYPESWEKVSNDTLAFLVNGPSYTDDDKLIKWNCSFSVFVQSMGRYYDINEVFENTFKKLISSNVTMKTVDIRDVEINGLPAKLFIMRFLDHEEPITNIYACFSYADKCYLLSGGYLSNEFENYKNTFLSIANSFKLNKK